MYGEVKEHSPVTLVCITLSLLFRVESRWRLQENWFSEFWGLLSNFQLQTQKLKGVYLFLKIHLLAFELYVGTKNVRGISLF